MMDPNGRGNMLFKIFFGFVLGVFLKFKQGCTRNGGFIPAIGEKLEFVHA